MHTVFFAFRYGAFIGAAWPARRRAAAHGLSYYNFIPLAEEIGIDWNTDTYDVGVHLNVFGAERLTSYFGNILVRDFGLENRKNNTALAVIWQAKLDAYQAERNGGA